MELTKHVQIALGETMQKEINDLRCCGNCKHFNGNNMPCDKDYSITAERICHDDWQSDGLTRSERV